MLFLFPRIVWERTQAFKVEELKQSKRTRTIGILSQRHSPVWEVAPTIRFNWWKYVKGRLLLALRSLGCYVERTSSKSEVESGATCFSQIFRADNKVDNNKDQSQLGPVPYLPRANAAKRKWLAACIYHPGASTSCETPFQCSQANLGQNAINLGSHHQTIVMCTAEQSKALLGHAYSTFEFPGAYLA